MQLNFKKKPCVRLLVVVAAVDLCHLFECVESGLQLSSGKLLIRRPLVCIAPPEKLMMAMSSQRLIVVIVNAFRLRGRFEYISRPAGLRKC